MLVLGIDEAGRGPIIGPMIISGFMIDDNKLDKLNKLGIKDSKLLTPKKREYLYKKLIHYQHKIIKIKPKEIDEAVEGSEINLNWLEALKTIEIINELRPNKVIIDCPSPNLNAYRDFILLRLKRKTIEVVVEHKADHKYKVVGAASILSKVIRDKEIKQLEKKYGDIGPGYMSNPTTKKFLEENWEKYPEIFRKSWSPWKKHYNNKNQKKLEGF